MYYVAEKNKEGCYKKLLEIIEDFLSDTEKVREGLNTVRLQVYSGFAHEMLDLIKLHTKNVTQPHIPTFIERVHKFCICHFFLPLELLKCFCA